MCSGGQLGRTGVRPKRERGEESHCGRGRQPPRIPRAAGYAPVGNDRPPWIIASTAGETPDLIKRLRFQIHNMQPNVNTVLRCAYLYSAASGKYNDLEVGGVKRQEARGQEEGHGLPLSPSPER